MVGQTSVTTCDNGSSFIKYESISIQEESSVSVKLEGDDSVYEVELFADKKHIVHQYLPREESSEIIPSSDFASNVASVHTSDENILKHDVRDIESNLSSCTGGYEFSTLVTDIDIKEEEICWNVKIESDDMTISMEDECTWEEMNDGDTEVHTSGQHDTKLQIEDAVVQCRSAVAHFGNGEETFKYPSCNIETTQEAVCKEQMCNQFLESPFQVPHCTSSSIQSSGTNNSEFQNRKRKRFKCPRTLEKESASMNYVERPYKCVNCTYTFSCKHKLVRHMRTHSGEKPFKCTLCPFSCTQKSDLIPHIRRHTGEKPFKCTQCAYSCPEKSKLTRHMRTHTGEKPYECAQCLQAFGRKNSLKTHMRTHTGEKPFECGQCNYTCSHKNRLEIHMLMHSGEKPFKCTQCTFTCTRKNDLKLHKLTHTGEKPLKCSLCTFACIQKCNLNAHMRTHSGEKPFRCTQCTYACSQKSTLKQHMRKHAG